jgi:hypothetical protein
MHWEHSQFHSFFFYYKKKNFLNFTMKYLARSIFSLGEKKKKKKKRRRRWLEGKPSLSTHPHLSKQALTLVAHYRQVSVNRNT